MQRCEFAFETSCEGLIKPLNVYMQSWTVKFQAKALASYLGSSHGSLAWFKTSIVLGFIQVMENLESHGIGEMQITGLENTGKTFIKKSNCDFPI